MNISASANQLPIGTRVAAEFDKDIWYLGTVVKMLPTGYRIDFDYGETNKLIKTRVFAVEKRGQIKKSLTLVQVKELKLGKKTATKKPVAKEPKAVLVPAKILVHVEHESHEALNAARNLESCRPLFDKAVESKSRTDMLHAISEMWKAANHVFFNNRLVAPTFLLLKLVKTVRGLGYWHRGYDEKTDTVFRKISLSPRLFNAAYSKLCTVLVHEMCHQAVSEINKVQEGAGGHGVHWEQWMRKCGLSPDRYNKDDVLDFMNTEERSAVLQRKEDFGQATAGLKRITPKALLPVSFFETAKGKMTNGLVVEKADAAGRKWVVVTKESIKTSSWLQVGYENMFEIPNLLERSDFLEDEFLDFARQVSQHRRTKK